MSSEWLQNMLGNPLSEEQVKTVPHPKLEVAIHVTVKAMQVFGFLGLCIIGPLMGIFSADSPGIIAKAMSAGHTGVMVGLVLGPILTFARLSNQTEEKILDRCYRLRRNKVQLRIDRATFAGMGIGSALGLFTVGICEGFALGIIAGAIVGVVLIIQSPPKKEK